jgi:limonene-1,2-epoxide hydrolase
VSEADDARKVEVGQAMIAAWNAMDWDAAAALMTEDAVLHSMMIDPIVGSSIDLQVRNMGVVNGTLYMERLDTFVCNGKPGATPVCGALEFEGDRIKVWREYYDRHHLLSEMGMVQDFDSATR